MVFESEKELGPAPGCMRCPAVEDRKTVDWKPKSPGFQINSMEGFPYIYFGWISSPEAILRIAWMVADGA